MKKLSPYGIRYDDLSRLTGTAIYRLARFIKKRTNPNASAIAGAISASFSIVSFVTFPMLSCLHQKKTTPSQEEADEEEIDTMMNKIYDEMLENVVGGKDVQVINKAASYANLRTAPGLKSDVKLRLDNGDWVGTTGRTEKKDGYNWYQVYVPGCEDCFGWIAGSLIGF